MLLAANHEGEKTIVRLSKSTNDLRAINIALKLGTEGAPRVLETTMGDEEREALARSAGVLKEHSRSI